MGNTYVCRFPKRCISISQYSTKYHKSFNQNLAVFGLDEWSESKDGPRNDSLCGTLLKQKNTKHLEQI